MLQRIITVLIAFPLAALLITLAVANRHDVRLVLDPFRPEQPAISVVLPFYSFLFGVLALGILAGGMAVWMSQGRWRRTARLRTQDARRWQAEADRLARERDAGMAAGASSGSGRDKPLLPALSR